MPRKDDDDREPVPVDDHGLPDLDALTRARMWTPGWQPSTSARDKKRVQRQIERWREQARGSKYEPTEKDYQEWCEEIYASVLGPDVERWVNEIQLLPPDRVHIYQPWQGLAQQKLVAQALSSAVTRGEVIEMRERIDHRWPPLQIDKDLLEVTDESPRAVAGALAKNARDAQAFVWTDKILEVALEAPLPPHVFQRNALQYEHALYLFEHPIWRETVPLVMGTGKDAGKATAITSWVLLTLAPANDTVMMVFDRWLLPTQGFQPQYMFVVLPLKFGMKWPEDFPPPIQTEVTPVPDPDMPEEMKEWGFAQHFVPEGDARNEVGDILRLLAFAQAPFVDALPHRPKLPRVVRRDFEKQGLPLPPDDLTLSIIRLRAIPNEPVWNGSESEELNDGLGRTYKHSWWVRGHYRWQWYPSEQTHRMRAIGQYVKQAGKPLLKKLVVVDR